MPVAGREGPSDVRGVTLPASAGRGGDGAPGASGGRAFRARPARGRAGRAASGLGLRPRLALPRAPRRPRRTARLRRAPSASLAPPEVRSALARNPESHALNDALLVARGASLRMPVPYGNPRGPAPPPECFAAVSVLRPAEACPVPPRAGAMSGRARPPDVACALGCGEREVAWIFTTKRRGHEGSVTCSFNGSSSPTIRFSRGERGSIRV